MHTSLPRPDTHVVYTHDDFETFKSSDKVKEVHFEAMAETGGSDISWNDFAGFVALKGVDGNNQMIESYGYAEIVRFTGNCGIKAISHVSFLGKKQQDVLKIIESFAFHKLNCGLLIGSDTDTTGKYAYTGATLQNLKKFGDGYQFGEAVWNPNYTGTRDHTVRMFWKDLTRATHTNYWSRPRVFSGSKQRA